jgi:predicted nucleotidyltransferase
VLERCQTLVSKKEAARALRMLLDEGFRFTIIGGTIIELALNSNDLGDDIDLFAEKPDILVEEEFYREVAYRRGWSIGQTWLGTPKIFVRINNVEVPVEFYDNLYDFYVPESMLNRALRIEVNGVRVKVLTVEDHIVLKANAGREKDLERLKEIAKYIKRGKLKVDIDKIKGAAEDFEDYNVIIRRLRDTGILA